MNKTLIGIIVVAIVAIGAYLMFKKGDMGSAMNDAQKSAAQSGSIASLAAMSAPSKCTVTHSEDSYESSGTVYVAGGKMRGDFSSTMSGKTVESHMISDGTTVYTWSSAMPQGVKMTVAATAQPQSPGAPAEANMFQQNVSYDCEAWAPDNSMFDLPSDVNFMDMSSMMQGMPGAGAGAEATGSAGASTGAPAGMSCAMCDSAPDGPARDQCRAALNCQ